VDTTESIDLLVMSSVVASTVLAIGTSFLYRLRSRVKSPLWPVAVLFAIAIGLAAFAAQDEHGHKPRPVENLDFLDGVGVFIQLWLLFDWVVDIRGSRGNGELEFSFPREWARELTWAGAAVCFMGALTMVCCIGLGATPNRHRMWLGVPLGAMATMWGYMTAKYVGKTEFRTHGIRLGSKFHSWTTLGKFEWYLENGEPTLRIRAGSGDIRIRWPEDSSAESVLLKHGLARW
jgi:hypothetical protein